MTFICFNGFINFENFFHALLHVGIVYFNINFNVSILEICFYFSDEALR